VIGHLSSSPVARAIATLGEERRSELAREVKRALQPYADGDGVAIPDEINVAIGHA